VEKIVQRLNSAGALAKQSSTKKTVKIQEETKETLIAINLETSERVND